MFVNKYVLVIFSPLGGHLFVCFDSERFSADTQIEKGQKVQNKLPN